MKQLEATHHHSGAAFAALLTGGRPLLTGGKLGRWPLVALGGYGCFGEETIQSTLFPVF